MKRVPLVLCAVALAATQCKSDPITSSSDGTVVTNLEAPATGGGSPFDGTLDARTDIDRLIQTAWGDGNLDLHRGHAPIQNVLERFLGITHDQMHELMEDEGLNLAGVCTRFGFDPEKLVDSLTNSFVPHLREGVANGVIQESELPELTARVREQFKNRVYWTGT